MHVVLGFVGQHKRFAVNGVEQHAISDQQRDHCKASERNGFAIAAFMPFPDANAVHPNPGNFSVPGIVVDIVFP
jgi:hypothetical protein